MDVIRGAGSLRMANVRVRLVRKLAERIDGVDLSRRSVGQVIRLPADQARLLIAEQWAESLNSNPSRRTHLRATKPSIGCPRSVQALRSGSAAGRGSHGEPGHVRAANQADH